MGCGDRNPGKGMVEPEDFHAIPIWVRSGERIIFDKQIVDDAQRMGWPKCLIVSGGSIGTRSIADIATESRLYYLPIGTKDIHRKTSIQSCASVISEITEEDLKVTGSQGQPRQDFNFVENRTTSRKSFWGGSKCCQQILRRINGCKTQPNRRSQPRTDRIQCADSDQIWIGKK